MEVAKAAHLKFNYLLDFQTNPNLKSYEKTLMGQMCLKNTPNITLECGSHDSYQSQFVTEIVEAICSLLAAFSVIENQSSNKNNDHHYYTNTKKYRATNGGFINFHKQPGDTFSKGDTLYETVYPDLNQHPDIVITSENGIVIKTSPTHIHWPGDEVMETVSQDNLIDLT